MKHFFTLLIIFSFRLSSSAQYSEFPIYPNGLIYDEPTMNTLHNIVDSLNLKFKTCELDKVYYSKKQALAHYFSLYGSQAIEAKKDLENNVSLEELRKKYPDALIEKDIILIKILYKDGIKDILTFKNVEIGESRASIIRKDTLIDYYNRDKLSNSWIWQYHPKSKYSNSEINAYLFTTEFKTTALPDEYARLIQYTNCMIDTSASIYDRKYTIPDSILSYVQNLDTSMIELFLNYVNEKTNKPSRKKYKKYMKWAQQRFKIIDNELVNEKKFQDLIAGAANEAWVNSHFKSEIIPYVVRYYSPKIGLEKATQYQPFGMCSQDPAPRIHAKKIAIYAAQSASWDVFLRAHLDIMNDNFHRVSDGSYAYKQRETYLKELEELDINIVDLLLGITLRIDNPAQNHYYGSIRRVGRALAESKNLNEIENYMLNMIADKNLDDYNRILIYYLFENYNYHLTSEKRKSVNTQKLKHAVSQMPTYISNHIKIE